MVTLKCKKWHFITTTVAIFRSHSLCGIWARQGFSHLFVSSQVSHVAPLLSDVSSPHFPYMPCMLIIFFLLPIQGVPFSLFSHQSRLISHSLDVVFSCHVLHLFPKSLTYTNSACTVFSPSRASPIRLLSGSVPFLPSPYQCLCWSFHTLLKLWFSFSFMPDLCCTAGLRTRNPHFLHARSSVCSL